MLNKLKSFSFNLTVVILSANWWLEATRIYAQAKEVEASENQKSYFLAYAFVLFLMALGVAVIARSGRRAEKPKMIEKELEYRIEKMSGRSEEK